MSDRELLRHHAGLVDQLATRLGVDLQEAAIAGAVAIDGIADAGLRCTNCPNPAHCETLLGQEATINQAPEFCRNRDLLHRLRP